MPYFKVTRIKEAYDHILFCVESYPSKVIFKEFVEYFEHTFLGKDSLTPPLFEHWRWSVFYRINVGLPTTTNSIEGWHRGLNDLVNIRNPNLGYFIDSLRQETEKIRNKIGRFLDGKYDVSATNNVKKEKLRIYSENTGFYSTGKNFTFLDTLLEKKSRHFYKNSN